MHTCEFWTRVAALTKEATGQTLRDLNVEDYGHLDSFHRDNVTLFNAISMASDKSYIVDSSKHPTKLLLLTQNPALEVFPIFRLRDPKGQICSALKRPTRLGKLIGTYVRTNREIYNVVRHRPHAVVHYEQLVRDPERTLSLLMQELGLSFDPRQLQWASAVRHNVGGNGMRRGSSSELKLDKKWRDQFTLLQKLVIDASTFPGRYPFVKLSLPGAH